MIPKKPYQIIPQLIEQPTWGGNYISTFKGLHLKSNKKIGQSYELSGSSQIAFSKKIKVSIADIVSQYPQEILGKKTNNKYQKMPLLIKFTQSLGNSFQLHVKKNDETNRWKPKPESWYFFEKGLMTLGINPETEMKEYKNMCSEIEKFMIQLSYKVQTNKIKLVSAKKQAREHIGKLNPWQFVNMCSAKKGLVVDLSSGGIHHSWEEDLVSLPLGNIVYEVQLDIDDPSSTLRSFDKGKMLNDGSVRPLTIKDYFTYINVSPKENLLSNIIREKNNERIIQTQHYCIDEIQIEKQKKEYIEDSFVHLFVKEGSVIVLGPDGDVNLQKGASCFIPYSVRSFSITPLTASSTLLKTHILY